MNRYLPTDYREGGVVFTISPLNLFAASRQVIGNRGAAGVDHQTVNAFQANSREEPDPLH